MRDGRGRLRPALAVLLGWLAVAIAGEARAACTPSATRLCLLGGRFSATLSWDDGSGSKTALVAAPRADGPASASGLFRFYESDPSNWEVLVKMVDGCRTNGRFWLLVSASTGFEWRLEVVDTSTSLGRAWFHPLDGNASGIADFEAFSACPPQGRPASVRYRNDLVCGDEAFVSTLSSAGGPSWQSRSGIPSIARDVPEPSIGPFVEANASPCGGTTYAGSFQLGTDRRWLLLQTIDDATGLRVLKIFDEGSARDAESPAGPATSPAAREDGSRTVPVAEIAARETSPGLRALR